MHPFHLIIKIFNLCKMEEEKIFTVGELIKWLQQFPNSTKIFNDATGFFHTENPLYYDGVVNINIS